MKKIIFISIFLLHTVLFAQVAIGKNTISSPSVSLEFGSTENKGILLPRVTSTSSVSNVVNGTLIYDITDHKVKVKYLSGWKDLSIDPSGVADTSIQDNLTENTNAKVQIGTLTSSAPGILVLEDTNKAMVLPKVVSPEDNIIDPSAGMMVYDPNNKRLCFFNGSVWTFWKF